MALSQSIAFQINPKINIGNERFISHPLKSRYRNNFKLVKCQAEESEDGSGAIDSPHPVVMATYKEQDGKLNQISQIKTRLLREVVGLDRGLAATGRQPQIIDGLVRELTDMSGKINLNWKTNSQGYSTMDDIQGVWRLAYTSAFTTGSLGGSRVGPPASIFPLILGSIYQVINTEMSQLDNVVEFFFNYSLPFTPQLSTPVLRASLKHSFEIEGDSTIRIVFKSTDLNIIGDGSFLDMLPTLELPKIPDFFQTQLRSATFEVVYLDDDIRITRGDRGELRIYARCFESSLFSPANLSSVDDD